MSAVVASNQTCTYYLSKIYHRKHPRTRLPCQEAIHKKVSYLCSSSEMLKSKRYSHSCRSRTTQRKLTMIHLRRSMVVSSNHKCYIYTASLPGYELDQPTRRVVAPLNQGQPKTPPVVSFYPSPHSHRPALARNGHPVHGPNVSTGAQAPNHCMYPAFSTHVRQK
jgi:hypothetical protein